MIHTMMESGVVNFDLQVNGKSCHEQEDTIDESSILVDQHLRYSTTATRQLIEPVIAPPSDLKTDKQKSGFIWQ